MCKPGPDRTPLDDDDSVFLMDLVDQSSYERVSPVVFRLTSEEKEREPEDRRRSAWEMELSSPEQIVDVLGNPRRRLVVTVDVDDVQSIEVEDADMVVCWDYKEGCLDSSGNRINGHSGCEGHCGIFGWPYGVPHASDKRKSVRRNLAEKAEVEGEVERD